MVRRFLLWTGLAWQLALGPVGTGVGKLFRTWFLVGNEVSSDVIDGLSSKSPKYFSSCYLDCFAMLRIPITFAC
jgi:hypothetical protein